MIGSLRISDTIIWSESFAAGAAPTVCQCQAWLEFWRNTLPNPSTVVSITLSGSLSAATYVCSGSAAQFLAFALATPQSEANVDTVNTITCESGVWFVGFSIWGTGSAGKSYEPRGIDIEGMKQIIFSGGFRVATPLFID